MFPLHYCLNPPFLCILAAGYATKELVKDAIDAVERDNASTGVDTRPSMVMIYFKRFIYFG